MLAFLQVTGPNNATVQYFNYAQNSTSSYQLLVQWDATYRGGVTVDLQSSRCDRLRILLYFAAVFIHSKSALKSHVSLVY